jgi:hypothetical protein
MSRGSSVGIATMPRAGRSSVRIPLGARGISLLQKVQIRSEAHPASYAMGTEVLSWGKAAGVSS